MKSYREPKSNDSKNITQVYIFHVLWALIGVNNAMQGALCTAICIACRLEHCAGSIMGVICIMQGALCTWEDYVGSIMGALCIMPMYFAGSLVHVGGRKDEGSTFGPDKPRSRLQHHQSRGDQWTDHENWVTTTIERWFQLFSSVWAGVQRGSFWHASRSTCDCANSGELYHSANRSMSIVLIVACQ